jgi:16S rRNA A1518/A1519 N6-dimethyltransferase RsmA/KsgA/DIM1 with predicted DNA glycosylase/AP lyase activity
LLENESKSSRNKRIEFGQHHLIDTRIILLLVQSIAPQPNEDILELGSGKGIVTRLVSLCSGTVHSYEVDRELFDCARLRCLDRPNVRLYNSDPLKLSLPKFDIFLSNIPYSKSRQVMTWLCYQSFLRGIIMLQEELSSKILCQPGEKDYTAISVVSQYCLTMEILTKVPPEAFTPQPLVSSVLIRINRKQNRLDLSEIRKIQLLFSKGKSYSKHAERRQGSDNLKIRKIRNLLPDEIVELARSA